MHLNEIYFRKSEIIVKCAQRAPAVFSGIMVYTTVVYYIIPLADFAKLSTLS